MRTVGAGRPAARMREVANRRSPLVTIAQRAAGRRPSAALSSLFHPDLGRRSRVALQEHGPAHEQRIPGRVLQRIDGELERDRWDSYVKLQRELHALEVRQNVLLRKEQVREYKIRTRAHRKRRRH